jgi:hypothetical protein
MVALNHPGQGSTNWYTPVDSNWTTIEQSLDQAICEGRLSLSNSVPAPITDILAATTLYYLPYKGNRISLYTGSTWQIYTIPSAGSGATSLSLSGLSASTTYDVFLYSNAGTLTLDKLAWTSVTATNSPAAGSNVTINLSNTSGVAVGSLVSIVDGARNSSTGLFNQETARVNTVNANTSIVVDTLFNSYTTPSVTYRSAVQDGILVKPGDATRRFLGTIRTTSTAGQCEDSQLRRFVCNYYNRIARKLFSCPGYANNSAPNTWSTTSGSWVEVNGGTGSKIEFLANGEDTVFYSLSVSGYASNNNTVYGGVGEDSSSSPALGSQANVPNATYQDNVILSKPYLPTEGYHYLDILVMTSAFTITITLDMGNVGSAAADIPSTYIVAQVSA